MQVIPPPSLSNPAGNHLVVSSNPATSHLIIPSTSHLVVSSNLAASHLVVPSNLATRHLIIPSNSARRYLVIPSNLAARQSLHLSYQAANLLVVLSLHPSYQAANLQVVLSLHPSYQAANLQVVLSLHPSYQAANLLVVLSLHPSYQAGNHPVIPSCLAIPSCQATTHHLVWQNRHLLCQELSSRILILKCFAAFFLWQPQMLVVWRNHKGSNFTVKVSLSVKLLMSSHVSNASCCSVCNLICAKLLIYTQSHIHIIMNDIVAMY